LSQKRAEPASLANSQMESDGPQKSIKKL